MQSFVKSHWSWNCNDVSVWRVCRHSLILFHQCISPTWKVSWKTVYSFGGGGEGGYKSASGHLNYTQTTTLQDVLSYSQIHTEIQNALPLFACDSLSFSHTQTHTHAHTHSCPLSVFQKYMQCPETELHAQLMSLLSRWLTLADSHSQMLPEFPLPPPLPLPLPRPRLTFCVELTPGLQVKIAAPSSSPFCLHTSCLEYQTATKWILLRESLHASWNTMHQRILDF